MIFLTKLKFAVLACGLIAASNRHRAACGPECARTKNSGRRRRRAWKSLGDPATPDDDDAAVARELERLDLRSLGRRHAPSTGDRSRSRSGRNSVPNRKNSRTCGRSPESPGGLTSRII